MPSYLALTNLQVALATLLILISGTVSVALKLGIERSLLLASVRTVVQLLLIGLVLEWVFGEQRWYVVLGLLAVMTLVAGITAAGRSERRYQSMMLDTILCVWVSSWIITGFALFAVMHGIEHWYQPQYSIPLLGMVLGNTLNGVSVGISTLTEGLSTRRDQVETALALGATRWEAARDPVQRAVRTGMIPIINSMMVVGIVSLPGMMTGQILAGASPVDAVKYQIVIMFLIASATSLGTAGVVLLSFRRLFSADHQFLTHRLKRREKPPRK